MLAESRTRNRRRASRMHKLTVNQTDRRREKIKLRTILYEWPTERTGPVSVILIRKENQRASWQFTQRLKPRYSRSRYTPSAKIITIGTIEIITMRITSMSCRDQPSEFISRVFSRCFKIILATCGGVDIKLTFLVKPRD
jgi:hypothetical protein